MTTAIALLTRDLRVYDNPVLAEAAGADRVVPVFVLDQAVLAGDFNRPNRTNFLLDCLADLRRSLRMAGGDLVIRRGDPTEEVRRLAEEVDATDVHLARDVSWHARQREHALEQTLRRDGRGLRLHEAVVTVQPPGALAPAGGDHFAVFTPYLRQWVRHPRRPLLSAPARLRSPVTPVGTLPSPSELCAGQRSPDLPRGGETVGRRMLADWLERGLHRYAEGANDPARDATSRLSPYLHFGCLSPLELVERAAASDAGSAFVRQLAWRDFHHQVLAAHPDASWRNYRNRGDRWRQDPLAFAAWQQGRTGYPLVDAGMRQLALQGWMHNRVRLVTASFLTKTLYLDWRLGARHFLDLLVDGDIANNSMNWQWVAGTGTDTRPNRVLNPVRQSRQHDPSGAYIRRYLPELSDLEAPLVHEPWRLPPAELARRGYPPPIVDLAEASERFLTERGRARLGAR